MNIKEYTDFLRISGVEINFDATFFSGQCFRWKKAECGYIGVVNRKIVLVYPQDNNTFDIYNCSPDEFKKFFYWYFDLDKDYDLILKELSEHDEILKKAVEKYRGMRLLNQEPFECMISFIISQNNNIKRIQILVERLCQAYGEKIEYRGFSSWTFPEIEDLKKISTEELKRLGLGYRAEYIKDAIAKLDEGKIDFESLESLSSDEARKILKTVKGIGDKVANCILLYSLQKYDVFPVDVWVKRALREYYGIENIKQLRQFIKSFGELAGYAQLFLFHYIRNSDK
ncbi:8-oxoguanine DNA glycosylase domain protein [Caldicellulosiruptor hydrothermalis 108]|uniref:DNA-(apurinic or apyrimidinic site) lyase n=1 Tax=Caldicellulosiruptor hydrothermalis (strain DSM 18901 / VKM B-2411 / 108) TaxID=632292 RepID=E4QC94_CALH1|nr:DNA-3-methyladenine glycosylase [Caldicellulosiruptor hydrothermalis]ADQ07386.1 8-oxoguanine DNA glycosylase domain protein [Caldicellulosiruptor hydrothermalis 108]